MRIILAGAMALLLGAAANGAEMKDTLNWNSGLTKENTDPELWELNERLSHGQENTGIPVSKTKKPEKREPRVNPFAKKAAQDAARKNGSRRDDAEPNHVMPKADAVNIEKPKSMSDEWVHPDDFASHIQRAQQGDAESQRIVGRAYMSGIGVKTDYHEGWKWLARAAGSGDLEAQYQLGVLYRDGIGVKKSAKEAAYWFRKAARNGHTLALLNIGHAFENGEGVLPDNRVAAENYWRAAERGNAEGAYRFATMLRLGKGIGQDLPRSLKYYLQAAEAQYPDAQVQADALIVQGVKAPAKPARISKPAASKGNRTPSANVKNKKGGHSAKGTNAKGHRGKKR